MRMSEILAEKFPDQSRSRFFPGPISRWRSRMDCRARQCSDVAMRRLAEELQATLGSSRFRVYTSHEIVGIRLGGALKNIFAIPSRGERRLRLR